MKRFVLLAVFSLAIATCINGFAQFSNDDSSANNSTNASAGAPVVSGGSTVEPSASNINGNGTNQNTAVGSNPSTPLVQTDSTASNNQDATADDVQGLSLDERVQRLEQQIRFMKQTQSPQQFAQLQQQVQDLRGQLDVQAHQLQVLQNQQRDIYQDLSNRLDKLKTGKSTKTSAALKSGAASDLAAIGSTENQLKEQDVYENAYSYIGKRNYKQAITALQDYLKAYPQGRFLVNAHYWLGELYLVNGDNANAKTQFNLVVTQFPTATKAADAWLKLGYMAYDEGKLAQARENFRKVVKRFPDSPAAHLANKRLQDISTAANANA
ncbi:MAG: tol-pal system protein YbgF [Legionellales bacterium]|nr:tol-pal system protein YbgF [Legionellales bacterium]